MIIHEIYKFGFFFGGVELVKTIRIAIAHFSTEHNAYAINLFEMVCVCLFRYFGSCLHFDRY